MRDQRFVAAHRGGPLGKEDHYLLAAWAADCAGHVRPLFERHCGHDERPRQAIAAARAWAGGTTAVGPAQKAALQAHAAAREAGHPAAVAAARSAGHAAATAHFADHCLGAALYALKAVEATDASPSDEYAWQIRQLPHPLVDLVISALRHRHPGMMARLTDTTPGE